MGPCLYGCEQYEFIARQTTDIMQGAAQGVAESANRYYPEVAKQAVFAAMPEGRLVAGPAKSAEAAADAALAAGRTGGAAAELRVGDRVFTDVSTGGAPRTLRPDVQAALDKVPPGQREPWHGHCAEPGCVSQALNAGVNPAGGTSRAVNIGDSGRGHGTPKMTCRSCQSLLDFFGIKHDF